MENRKQVRKVFVNPEYQKQIEEDGYCLLNLFTNEEISALEKVYLDNKVSEQPSIELTLKSEDYQLKKRIAEGIASVIGEKVGSLLDDYTYIFSGFITKNPDRDNVSALHQDPTVTDEDKFPSINVWIPLTDVDESNGAVNMVKRSHLFYPGFRSNRVGKYDFSLVKSDVMNELGTPVKMKKGDALIYDTRLFHFSKQNISGKPRIASASIFIPNDAQPMYYYHNIQNNTIEIYEINTEFFLNYVDRFFKGTITSEKLLSSVPFTSPIKVSMDEFRKKYNEHNPSGFRKFLKWIGV